jgi:hypothetical protein
MPGSRKTQCRDAARAAGSLTKRRGITVTDTADQYRLTTRSISGVRGEFTSRDWLDSDAIKLQSSGDDR